MNEILGKDLSALTIEQLRAFVQEHRAQLSPEEREEISNRVDELRDAEDERREAEEKASELQRRLSGVQNLSIQQLQDSLAYESNAPEVRAAMVARLEELKKEKIKEAERENLNFLQSFGFSGTPEQGERHFHWPGVLVAGEVHGILCESAEESTRFVADVAARVSTGSSLLTGEESFCGDVLLISPKPEIVIEQIKALGGNVERIRSLTKFDAENSSKIICALADASFFPVLIVLDSIPDIAGGALSATTKAAEMMSALRGFAGSASCVVFTTTPNRIDHKKAKGNAIWTTGPSVFMTLNAAGPDVWRLKVTRGGSGDFAYRADESGALVVTEIPEGTDQGETTVTKTKTAEIWLRGVLAGGPLPKAKVVALAEAANLKEWQLKAAQKSLQVVSELTPTTPTTAVWSLPG
jgi:hypothetical protein